MNSKAEKFLAYLDEKKINAFTHEEVEGDQFSAEVFRSTIDIGGNRLPTIVILDNSVYGMIRVLVAPNAVHDGNENALLKLVNDYNKKFKVFKYYVDDQGSLVLDLCVLGVEADGNMIYAMFDVIINHLNDSYKDIMKAIWG